MRPSTELLQSETAGFYSTQHDNTQESGVGILLHWTLDEAISAASDAAWNERPDRWRLDEIEVGALVPMGRPSPDLDGTIDCVAELRPEVAFAIVIALAEFFTQCDAWLSAAQSAHESVVQKAAESESARVPLDRNFANGAVDAAYSQFVRSIDAVFGSARENPCASTLPGLEP